MIFHNPPPHEVGVGVNFQKIIFFLEFNERCGPIEKCHVYQPCIPWVWGGGSSLNKFYFASNCIKFPDLHRKVRFANHHLLCILVGRGPMQKRLFLLEIERNSLICTEK